MGERGGAHAGPLSSRERQTRRGWVYALAAGVPAVLLASALLIRSHHAGWVGHFLLKVAVVMVLLIGHGIAVARAAKRTSPRPRSQYFLFCLSYLGLAAASAAVGGLAEAHHIAWLSGVMVIPAGLSVGGILVMFGRGAFRGRLRRSFWRIPPPWLSQDVSGSRSGAAGAGD
jgi:hypothetical protein